MIFHPALPLPPLAAPIMPDPRLYNWHRQTPENPRQPLPPTGAGYIPELAERLERDPNLTDGARRTARILAAYAFRRDRTTRTAAVTVSYLQRALGRCRRTVQNHLRELERGGYIRAAVDISRHSGLCIGLAIELLTPLFARHHARKWPDKAIKSGAQKSAHNYRETVKTSIEAWDTKCRIGMEEALWNIRRHLLSPPPDFLTV